MKRCFTGRLGFTLIELLVVVLIIGILVAVAVPQYQKAVEKSKAVQGIALVRSLAQAAQAYYLESGEYATSTNELAIFLSEVQKEEFFCETIASACDKKEWGVDVYRGGNDGRIRAVIAWRTSGKYKGGGFVMYQKSDSANLEPNTLYCYERNAGPNKIENTGNYCQKLFNGTRVSNTGNAYQYVVP